MEHAKQQVQNQMNERLKEVEKETQKLKSDKEKYSRNEKKLEGTLPDVEI